MSKVTTYKDHDIIVTEAGQFQALDPKSHEVIAIGETMEQAKKNLDKILQIHLKSSNIKVWFKEETHLDAERITSGKLSSSRISTSNRSSWRTFRITWNDGKRDHWTDESQYRIFKDTPENVKQIESFNAKQLEIKKLHEECEKIEQELLRVNFEEIAEGNSK